MNYYDVTVGRLTPESLTTTREAWLATAEQLDMPAVDFEQQLDWASSRINYDEPANDSLAYGIFAPDGAVLGFLDVIYTRRGGATLGWLKLMTVRLSPDFAPSEVESNPEKIDALKAIYTAAITGTVGLTDTHSARVVKLYGRDSTLLTLLVSLKDYLKEHLGTEGAKFDVRMDGRWLVISSV